MFSEFWTHLSHWYPWDTSMVIAASLVAMACTVPGVWLVLRQQSLMGDALSHTALPGVVLAILAANGLDQLLGDRTGSFLSETLLLFAGAVLIGVLTAFLTEWVQRFGRVESSAALGVVFTSLFALGLLLIRLLADDVHLDPDCVLFGQLELIIWDTVSVGGIELPRAYLVNGGMLLLNLLLVGLFFKELRLSAFDPEMAATQGIPPHRVQDCLMAMTAVTVVVAFESVGSILVIALLIVPAATAMLLSNRLRWIIPLSLCIAAISPLLGQILSKTLPVMLAQRLGFGEVQDAGTSGMTAVACGLLFVMALLCSPQQGLLARISSRVRFRLQMAQDDLLSTVYRFEEQLGKPNVTFAAMEQQTVWIRPVERYWALWSLRRRGFAETAAGQLCLTEAGRAQAAELVGSHRLWESYMQKHFDLPDDHLHESAHYVEHFLDADLRSRLREELDSPELDPHGRPIPGDPTESND